jgi:MYXO-CTERM domain-containing protein
VAVPHDMSMATGGGGNVGDMSQHEHGGPTGGAPDMSSPATGPMTMPPPHSGCAVAGPGGASGWPALVCLFAVIALLARRRRA